MIPKSQRDDNSSNTQNYEREEEQSEENENINMEFADKENSGNLPPLTNTNSTLSQDLQSQNQSATMSSSSLSSSSSSRIRIINAVAPRLLDPKNFSSSVKELACKTIEEEKAKNKKKAQQNEPYLMSLLPVGSTYFQDFMETKYLPEDEDLRENEILRLIKVADVCIFSKISFLFVCFFRILFGFCFQEYSKSNARHRRKEDKNMFYYRLMIAKFLESKTNVNSKQNSFLNCDTLQKNISLLFFL